MNAESVEKRGHFDEYYYKISYIKGTALSSLWNMGVIIPVQWNNPITKIVRPPGPACYQGFLYQIL